MLCVYYIGFWILIVFAQCCVCMILSLKMEVTFSSLSTSIHKQISDFGLSRDLENESYYISHGGKIPVKWTSPEVCTYGQFVSIEANHKYTTVTSMFMYIFRHFTIRSTPLPVMCGALAVSCMRYGVSDTNLLRIVLIWRYQK